MTCICWFGSGTTGGVTFGFFARYICFGICSISRLTFTDRQPPELEKGCFVIGQVRVTEVRYDPTFVSAQCCSHLCETGPIGTIGVENTPSVSISLTNRRQTQVNNDKRNAREDKGKNGLYPSSRPRRKKPLESVIHSFTE